MAISTAPMDRETQKALAASQSFWNSRCSWLSWVSSLPGQQGKHRAVSRKESELQMAH